MGPLTALLGDDADVAADRDLQYLLLATFTYPLGVPYISPILESLTGPFAVSPGRVGLLVSAFFGPAIFVTAIAGGLADRYGRKRVLVWSLLLHGAGGLAIPLTTDFRVALAFRVLQGVGAAGLLPVIVTSIGDLYAGDAEATAQGLRTVVHGIAAAVTPLLAGLLLLAGWRYPFLVYGLAIPIALVIARRFDEPVDTAADRDGGGYPVRRLLRLARSPRVAAVLAADALAPFIFVGFLTYNSFIVVRGLDGTPQAASLVAAVAMAAFAVGGSQAGRITARFETRYPPLVAINAALGVGLVIIALAPSIAVMTAGAFVIGVGFGLALTFYRSMLTRFGPPDLRGGLVGLGESAGRVGATLPPVVLGAVIASATPGLDLVAAVRFTSAGAGVIAGSLAIVLVLLAWASPAIDPADTAA